ncbi:hypothetical protein P5V15_007622 [Pogonomyrmex californicus]
MAAFNARFCLFTLAVSVIVCTLLVQGRSLRRRHGHHPHSDYYDDGEWLPRDLSGRLEDNSGYYRDSYRQAEKRHNSRIPDRSSEYENSKERVASSIRRYKHEFDLWNRESSSRRKEDSPRKYNDTFSMRFFNRRKRFNKFEPSPVEHNGQSSINVAKDSVRYEMEVREAQNLAVCNYTVESIPVPENRSARVPRILEHIKCNHIGSRCQGTNTACCIQTYRNITVFYGDGTSEIMKIYVGCICALKFMSRYASPFTND